MMIKNKLTLLLVLLAAMFLAAFIVEEHIEKTEFIYVIKDQAKNENKMLDRIMELKFRPLINFVTDYTYWDEMVSFVKSGDKNWAALNLDTALNTFGANLIWVYDPDFKPVYSSSNLKIDWPKEIPISRDVLQKVFARRNFCDFFINSPQGVIKIFAGTIHATADRERTLPGQGYFFVGRLCDNNYVKDLELLTGGRVTISPITSWEKLFPNEGSKFDEGRIQLNRTLLGPNSEPVANLVILIESPLAQDYNHYSKYNLIIFVGFLLISFLMLSVTLIYLVNRPLGMIAKALNFESAGYVDNLKKRKDEFGGIAQLITRFFNQKAVLLKEIVGRKQTEESLRQSTNKYEALIEIIPFAVYTIDKEGFVTGWSASAERMFGWKEEEALGKPLVIVPSNKTGECRDLRKEVLNGKYVQGFRTQRMTKDGILINVLLYASPLRDEMSNIIGIMNAAARV